MEQYKLDFIKQEREARISSTVGKEKVPGQEKPF